MVSIALSRLRTRAVNLAVGDCDISGRISSQNNVLTTNARGLDVVDPDHVGAIDGNTIASPDEIGVDVGDVDVLDDDVADTMGHAQTAHSLSVTFDQRVMVLPFALDNTLATLSNDSLVRRNSDTRDTSLVVGDIAHCGCFGFIFSAPVVFVDCYLALRASAPRRAAGRCRRALTDREVKFLVEDDDAGLVIAKVGDQLSRRSWSHGFGISSTGDPRSEALSRAGDSCALDGSCRSSQCSAGTEKSNDESLHDDMVKVKRRKNLSCEDV